MTSRLGKREQLETKKAEAQVGIACSKSLSGIRWVWARTSLVGAAGKSNRPRRCFCSYMS
jgi:hypothetical protein